jgi:hypothetical protein
MCIGGQMSAIRSIATGHPLAANSTRMGQNKAFDRKNSNGGCTPFVLLRAGRPKTLIVCNVQEAAQLKVGGGELPLET